VREYLLDNHGVFNAGNDLGGATAMSACFDICFPLFLIGYIGHIPAYASLILSDCFSD
jgi:hypothetical protein